MKQSIIVTGSIFLRIIAAAAMVVLIFTFPGCDGDERLERDDYENKSGEEDDNGLTGEVDEINNPTDTVTFGVGPSNRP